jgi:hypothetical protein
MCIGGKIAERAPGCIQKRNDPPFAASEAQTPRSYPSPALPCAHSFAAFVGVLVSLKLPQPEQAATFSQVCTSPPS